MEVAIRYFTESQAAEARDLSLSARKPMLIDYWATNCKGCERMDALTYEDPLVQEYLSEYYVVLKCHISNISRDFASQFMTTVVLWTPSLFMYAPDGHILRTTVGYASPRHFITELEMGRATLLMRYREYAKALDIYSGIAELCDYPQLQQEALYWSGVAAFFHSRKDLSRLMPYWNTLMTKFPGTIWADKANVLPAE